VFDYESVLLDELKPLDVTVPYTFLRIDIVKDWMVRIQDELSR